MPAKSKVTPEKLASIRTALERGDSMRATAQSLGVSPGTIKRALTALGRIADRTRTAAEFTEAIARHLRAPVRQQSGTYSWSVETIRAARDAQMDGDFMLPVKLAKAMRTDDALFTAYHNRIAPQNAIATELRACEGSRGEAVRRKALISVFTSLSTLAGLHGTLVNHGIAIGYNEHEPTEDGSRIDFRLTEWPLEHVKWNASREVLETSTRGGVRVPIVHGNGEWTIFRKFEIEPWTQDACVLPGSLLWAVHANGVKDWAAGSASHGRSKIIAELPPGVALQQSSTELSPQALAILNMLQDILSGESGVGLRPAGSKTDVLQDDSTAWQVFSEMIISREKAAARIYTGTDAMLGSVGGAPGVDIAQLFGVATTKLQADFRALSQGLNTGVYQPWAAINEGSSRYAPTFGYLISDPDAEAKSKEEFERRERLTTTLKNMKAEGLVIDQPTVDALATRIGVYPIPQLATNNVKIPIPLAPTDLAKAVRVFQVLGSLGLELFGDERDRMTLTELDENAKAKAAARLAAAEEAAKAAAAGAPPPAAAPAELPPA